MANHVRAVAHCTAQRTHIEACRTQNKLVDYNININENVDTIRSDYTSVWCVCVCVAGKCNLTYRFVFSNHLYKLQQQQEIKFIYAHAQQIPLDKMWIEENEKWNEKNAWHSSIQGENHIQSKCKCVLVCWGFSNKYASLSFALSMIHILSIYRAASLHISMS